MVSELEKRFGWEQLSTWRVLLLNAGGLSQRLPSASVLGKIFGALPVGDPMYQMLDIKLASYLPFLKRMAPGFFHGPSDTIEVYDFGVDNENGSWDLNGAGFTALAHPSALRIGTGHGVYVLEPTTSDTSAAVEKRHCREVLQKPTIELMRKKNAVIYQGSDEPKEVVYTDSAFSFDHGVAKKLVDFYRAEEPLNCEIDAYGDFLQALGPDASDAYTRDTRNVGHVDSNLVKMRRKIFELLRGTALTVIALNRSQFHHFGTVSECLDHFCEGDVLGRVMGFQKWVSSKRIGSDEDTEEPTPKRARRDDAEKMKGCVMRSALHADSVVDERSVVEFCHFEIPVTVGRGSIISNCELLRSAREEQIVLPENTFLHTVPLFVGDATKFATVVFGSDDDLKKSVTIETCGDLGFCGRTLKEMFDSTLDSSVFADGKASLWTAKLFPAADTMSESMSCALRLLEAGKSKLKRPKFSAPSVSVADIVNCKDVSSMLEYRNKLRSVIVAEGGCP